MAKQSFYPKIEEKILEFWEKNNIFQKSIDQREASNSYVFYDGPPFANGLPHYGHILSSVVKDVVPRFWTMKGHRIERRWGWDCHGLPVESEVEKMLKLKNRKDIEKLGILKFNEACRNSVLTFVDEWRKTVRRIGRWVDFDHSYKTMDNAYIESVWWAFSQLQQKQLIYEGLRISLFCPHCETPLTNFEIAMDNSYQEVTEDSVYIKYKLKSQPDTFLLAWTTTPWTLIDNLAVAVGPEINYVKVKAGNEFLIVAKDRLGLLKGEPEVVQEMKGKELERMEYEPHYELPTDKKGWYVVLGDFVTTEDGSGLVHMAMYGEDDFNTVLKYDLPTVQHLGSDGKLIVGPKPWIGIWFKDLDALVINDLEQRNLLYRKEPMTHPYPFCYRCSTPLFYKPQNAWFIKVSALKSEMLKLNQDIHWIPDHLKDGRFGKGIEAAPDWNISRSRFWGSPVPVWKCKQCSKMKTVGSIEELATAKGYKEGVDLHRPSIDALTFECSCGGTMQRIPEVFDCWVESGSMPFAQKHYPFEHRQEFEANFPAEFVSEYIAQTRAWFYTMHVLSTALFDRPAFKHVISTGVIQAEDGQKMSKSKKNYPDPWLLIEKYGMDAIRYYLMSSPLMTGDNLDFSEKGVEEVYKKLVLLTLNVLSFEQLFREQGQSSSGPALTNVLDQWILARLFQTWERVSKGYEAYEIVQATRPLETFINDLSTWYVRRSRGRFKGQDAQDKQAAQWTLRTCLLMLSKLMAPVMPFLAEHLHQELNGSEESVHLAQWPTLPSEWKNETVIDAMAQLRQLVTQGLEARVTAGLPIRQPLAELKVAEKQKISNDAVQMEQLLKEELNVRAITWGAPVQGVELDTTLTKELEKEGVLRELTRVINQQRKIKGMKPGQPMVLVWFTADALVQETITDHGSVLQQKVSASALRKEQRPNAVTAQVHGSDVHLDLDIS